VKRLKNTFPPINRFPPEVLALIPAFFREDRDLINATAVCSHWRVTFLSTPRLWCDINVRSIPMVSTYLERSGDVPLYVRCTASMRVPSLLRPHMRRIVSLDIKHKGRGLFSQVLQNLYDPAPMLRALTFRADHDDLFGLDIPHHFLGGSFPSLRKLVLIDIYSFATPYIFQTVTTLIWTTNSDLIDEFLKTLDSLPSLEVASIQFHPPFRPASTRANRTIILQHLRRLSLTANIEPERGLCGFTLPILHFIDLPNLISLQAGGSFKSRVLPPSVLFAERLPGLSELPEAEISLPRRNSARVRLSGSRQSELIISVEDVSDVDVTCIFSGGTPFRSVRKLIAVFGEDTSPQVDRWVLDALEIIAGVETLEVVGDCIKWLNVWRGKDMYHRICPSLRRLTVSGGMCCRSELSVFADLRNSVGLPLIATYENA